MKSMLGKSQGGYFKKGNKLGNKGVSGHTESRLGGRCSLDNGTNPRNLDPYHGPKLVRRPAMQASISTRSWSIIHRVKGLQQVRHAGSVS